MLTRAEELILLAVWRLKDRAYSVEIRGDLKAVTGRPWSFGAVYMPLDRLTKRGLLQSYLADPTSERGGRSKRIYSLTNEGHSALKEIRRIQDTAWKGLPSRMTEDVK
ncbi:MAG: PadR family transcriptional regulator [Candidatus Aminicenantaceae bacterium]